MNLYTKLRKFINALKTNNRHLIDNVVIFLFYGTIIYFIIKDFDTAILLLSIYFLFLIFLRKK